MENWRKELYLAHHGIKGQRWGIRRFQNKDGSLTALGRKKLHKNQAVINKPRDDDYVVVAKKGEVVNRVTDTHDNPKNRPRKDIKNRHTLYVSKDPDDLVLYLNQFSGLKNSYNTKLTVLQDLVSPSEKVRVETFVRMYADNKVSVLNDIGEAELAVRKRVLGSTPYSAKNDFLRRYEKMEPEKLYEVFADTLSLNVNGQSEYFNRLRDRGYNAWLDDHDNKERKSGGMGTKTAMVVFEPIKDLRISKIEKYTPKEMEEIRLQALKLKGLKLAHPEQRTLKADTSLRNILFGKKISD